MTRASRRAAGSFARAFLRATLIPITFDWTAPLLFVFYVARDLQMYAIAPNLAALGFAYSVVALVIALFFHEWAHAAAALVAGGRAGEVRVHGFGAWVSLAGVPVHKQGAVVAAGPVMNLTVAMVCGSVAFLFGFELFARIASLNFFLGVFNLIPFGPLDGGALSRLGDRARVARTSAWMMAGLIVAAQVILFLSLASLGAGLSGSIMGLVVALGAIAGAAFVGWHGVLNALSEDRNEWGEIVESSARTA